MYIEISEKKMEDLSEHIEKALKYMGKAMQCVSAAMEESDMGERGGRGDYDGRSMMGSRGGYGNRDDEWDDDDEMMAERRRRSRRTGRFM